MPTCRLILNISVVRKNQPASADLEPANMLPLNGSWKALARNQLDDLQSPGSGEPCHLFIFLWKVVRRLGPTGGRRRQLQAGEQFLLGLDALVGVGRCQQFVEAG